MWLYYGIHNALKKKYKIKSRIWIDGESGPYLSMGRIDLLKNIHKHGSISKAAKVVNMSYSKAWKMIDAVNKEANSPLVIRVSGGLKGGGTELTGEGVKAIAIFDELNKKTIDYLDREFNEIKL